MLDNPYAPPNDKRAMPSVNWRDTTFAWAGCFLTATLVLRHPTGTPFVLFALVSAAVFGTAHFIIPYRKTTASRSATVGLTGAVSGAACGAMSCARSYDVTTQMGTTTMFLAIAFATVFACGGACIGFCFRRLLEGHRELSTNA